MIENPPVTPVPAFLPAYSSNTVAVFSWPALVDTDTGGSPITTYKVRLTTGGTTVSESDVTSPTVTFSSLTGGTTYLFVVAAANKYGTGAYSSSLAIVTSEVPE